MLYTTQPCFQILTYWYLLILTYWYFVFCTTKTSTTCYNVCIPNSWTCSPWTELGEQVSHPIFYLIPTFIHIQPGFPYLILVTLGLFHIMSLLKSTLHRLNLPSAFHRSKLIKLDSNCSSWGVDPASVRWSVFSARIKICQKETIRRKNI